MDDHDVLIVILVCVLGGVEGSSYDCFVVDDEELVVHEGGVSVLDDLDASFFQ